MADAARDGEPPRGGGSEGGSEGGSDSFWDSFRESLRSRMAPWRASPGSAAEGFLRKNLPRAAGGVLPQQANHLILG